MSEDFRKILDMFDKESVIDIVDRFNFPKAGKKSKHIEIILKNSTILEYAIKNLVSISLKDDLIDIAKQLGIESDTSASELKQQILHKLNNTISDKDLQNKIKFLNICFEKDEIFEVLENYNMPKAGKKSKLMELIAKNDSMIEYAINYWKKDSYKDQIEDLCDKLGINSDGSRKDLENKIEDYLFKKEKTSSIHNKSSIESERKSTVSKTKESISEEDMGNNFENFDPYEMEELVAKLFKAKGYEVEATKKSGDYGIDVWASNSSERIGIQVKHQNSDVGYDVVAKTIGSAMTSNKIILVSTKSAFTKQVYAYQIDHQTFIELWNSERLKKEIRHFLIETAL